MNLSDENERDLDAEQRAFEQRGWVFRLVSPVRTSPPNAPDPRVVPLFLAKARKDGDARTFQSDGATADEARSALLDMMFDAISVTEGR